MMKKISVPWRTIESTREEEVLSRKERNMIDLLFTIFMLFIMSALALIYANMFHIVDSIFILFITLIIITIIISIIMLKELFFFKKYFEKKDKKNLIIVIKDRKSIFEKHENRIRYSRGVYKKQLESFSKDELDFIHNGDGILFLEKRILAIDNFIKENK